MKVCSTNVADADTNSQSSDDSGNVYDFKNSKSSGVVVVTKTWEDSLSNDERPVPDVSISTEKPSKNPLGYTITYHVVGSAFSDGSTENELIVNSSGKIVSGQYKELTGSSGWYSNPSCTSKVELDLDGLPVNGLVSDMDLYAKPKTFILKTGSAFSNLIPSTATSVVFTDESMPASATLIDVDADGDGGVTAWTEDDGSTMKVSTQIKGLKVQANLSSSYMFYNKTNLKNIDLTLLDTQNVTSMRYMFYGCSGLTNLSLSHLDTSNVTTMSAMFRECSKLTDLNLSHLNVTKVTDASGMFSDCSELTNLNISSWNTANVTSMSSMFRGCSKLINLNLSTLNTAKVTSMSSMFEKCSGLARLNFF